MKLFFSLLTIVLVKVSANDEADFKKEVTWTNKMIELAFNKNNLVIGDNSPANKMELLFYIPGNLYLRTQKYANLLLSRSKYYQFLLQLEIQNTLRIAIPEVDAGRDFGSLNLTTLAEQRRCLVESALKNIFRREFESMYDQFIMQLEIRDTLNTEGLNLTTLTEKRRVTGKSLENVIRRVLGTGTSDDVEDQISNNFEVDGDQRYYDVSEDNEDQTTDVSEVVEGENRSKNDPYLFRMCRLMGLYMSTKFPASYIKEIEIDPINYTCSLDNGILQRRLKKINGVWWQISSITSELFI